MGIKTNFRTREQQSSPSPTDRIIISTIADAQLSSMVQVLFNKVIVNSCLFTLTSFSKQSASWQVLEICELCALSTDSRKTYSSVRKKEPLFVNY